MANVDSVKTRPIKPVADIKHPPAITRLLIANRGEISRRIIRSAHAMGISTVAVYANDDRDAPFVREADEAIALGGDSARETYLDAEKILAVARACGADAIHPGYGFLSENAEFARSVVEAGINWVGPSPEAIGAMGDKLSAKRLMERAGVPQLPSSTLESGADVALAAESIGFPLLVKASAGGGGRGMRVVEHEQDLADALDAARREAQAAFGDDTVFLERWLSRAHHVEIQVLGDHHGHLVHCFERECSIQRRHQKIIEEAPSPSIDALLRARMGEAAVAAAKAIHYYSAGTVEFLVEGEEFWFLEMNTRLQVEHPVTEAITGLDLVREQLRIAQGEPLDFAQDALSISGHSIEARIYAEDPLNDFLPVTGEILAWTPSSSTPARFDSGIEAGCEIGIEFDPLLAKVIVHAPTRREAVLRLARALETTRLQGVINNRDFLVNTLRTSEFLAGDVTTDFIGRVEPAGNIEPTPELLVKACLAATLAGETRRRSKAVIQTTIPSGWRNTRMPPEKTRFQFATEILEVQYRCQRDNTYVCWVAEQCYRVRVVRTDDAAMTLEIDDRRLRVELLQVADRWLIHFSTGDLELEELPRFPIPDKEAAQGGLIAPMPGKVVVINVAVGDVVEAGQQLLILEAMKMEHRIVAASDGVVSEMRVQPHQQVTNGELLVIVSPT